MVEVKEQMKEALEKAIKHLVGEEVPVVLEHPKDAGHGDYATSVALGLAKKLGKSPLDLAKEIAEILNTKYQIPNTYSRVEVMPPGFINFFLSEDYLISQMKKYFQDSNGTIQQFNNDSLHKRIMLEFADPNPFKEFHIGHLLNIILGESFARLLEAQGAKVWRVNYQGDVGMHVAKCLFGILQKSTPIKSESKLDLEEMKKYVEDLEKKPLEERIKLLGESYTIGAAAYEENEEKKAEIRSINIKVYQITNHDGQADEVLKLLWDKGRQWSLEHFEKIYARVGTKYEHYYFESAIASLGRELVAKYTQTGVFEASEGAIVFRGDKYGLHTRVFLTKEGYATYEGKDMALATVKAKDYPVDRSIIITAHEQAEYFKVVLAALSQIDPSIAQKTEHHSFGFVRLKDAKMSSRLGNIIAGDWLLDESKNRLRQTFPDMEEEVLEQVAVGAVKYSMLKFSRGSDIAFSLEESINLERNSGPYIQYTYARTRSILEKVKSQKSTLPAGRQEVKNTNQSAKVENELVFEEMQLLKLINRFNEIVDAAATDFAPHVVCNYLFNLAQTFNGFYQKHQVVGSKQEQFRLQLTDAVGNVLKRGLYLLGIEAPEKM